MFEEPNDGAVVDAALIDGHAVLTQILNSMPIPHHPKIPLEGARRSGQCGSDAGRRSREPERAHSLRPLDVFVGLRMKFEVHESKPNLELIRYDFLENSAEQPTRSVR